MEKEKREYACPDCEQTEFITDDVETCVHCGEGVELNFYDLPKNK